jgi:hypothetical protein
MKQPAAQPAPTVVERAATLDEIVELPAADTVTLPSGRRLVIEARGDGERLTVTSRGGRVELAVVFTDAGPRLVFDAAEVEFKTIRGVTVACENLDVAVRDTATLRGARVELRADAGDVDVRAHDRVVLVGEEVRLNCDAPDTVPPWMKEALRARLVPVPEANVFLPARAVTGDASLDAEHERRRGTPG